MKKFQFFINVTVIILALTTVSRLFQWHKKCSSYFYARREQEYSIWNKLKVAYPVLEKKPIVVIIPSYNNAAICEKNLDSVFRQNYQNYRVIYIDDSSTDRNYERVAAYIASRGVEDRVTLMRNETRQLKMANLYRAIHMCRSQEIVLLLDADDWLAHESVFEVINRAYQNPDVWMTYGSAIIHPQYAEKSGAPYPDKMLLRGEVRDKGDFRMSTLRTFYAGLFKQIQLKDFLYKGTFLPSADDIAYMYPLIEMAPEHTLFIPEILYIINDNNPIRDVKVTSTLQREIYEYLQKVPKYKPLPDNFSPTVDTEVISMKEELR